MVSIVIPVYNEGKNIQKVLEAIEATVVFPTEILVVYDRENDTTIGPVQEMMGKIANLCLIKNRYGDGLLNAFKTGLASSNADAVIWTTADSSDDPKTMNEMWELYRKGADIVCASRYMNGGKQLGSPLIKGLMSRLAGLSLHYLTGIPTHDPTNTFKLFRLQAIKNMAFESKGGPEVAMEITVKAYVRGLIIKEVPTVWRGRGEGESQFRLLAWLPRYLHWYLHCFKALRKNKE